MSLSVTQLCTLFVVFWCVISGSLACFIRNCPPGGKRALDVGREGGRQCMSCGPGNRGQCVGPKLCCGKDIGCYMGTQEASVCEKENESTTPCAVKGEPCGARNQGHCVADGYCCVDDACSYNAKCQVSQEESSATRQELLQLVQRLLRSKNYD